jgi:aryl-alcohol dehydrogenase-like predicted oxidoreductase
MSNKDYRYLGDTGVKISPLCLGTMSFGADADPDTAAAMFARCREVGFLETDQRKFHSSSW